MSARPGAGAGREPLVCSAKGCRSVAARAVVWRNPRLHTADRRKVWLACPDHEQHLSDFVAMRGFLLEVIDVDELGAGDG